VAKIIKCDDKKITLLGGINCRFGTRFNGFYRLENRVGFIWWIYSNLYVNQKIIVLIKEIKYVSS